jgi:hypothetical protein
MILLGFTSMGEGKLIGSPMCAPSSDKTTFCGRFESFILCARHLATKQRFAGDLNRWYFMEVKSFKHFLFNIYCVID